MRNQSVPERETGYFCSFLLLFLALVAILFTDMLCCKSIRHLMHNMPSCGFI